MQSFYHACFPARKYTGELQNVIYRMDKTVSSNKKNHALSPDVPENTPCIMFRPGNIFTVPARKLQEIKKKTKYMGYFQMPPGITASFFWMSLLGPPYLELTPTIEVFHMIMRLMFLSFLLYSSLRLLLSTDSINIDSYLLYHNRLFRTFV